MKNIKSCTYNYFEPKVILFKNFEFVEKGQFLRTEIVSFDKRGNEIKRVFDKNNKVFFVYNSENKLISRFHLETDSTAIYKHKFICKYNSSGKIETEIYIEEGFVEREVKPIYKFQKSTNTEIFKYENSATSNQYDKRGNLIVASHFYLGNLSSKNIYHYNEKNQKTINIDMQFCYDGIVNTIYTKYDYDFTGNLIKEEINYVTECKENIIKTYKYKFDTKGNWLEKIEYNNDEPKLVIERKIKYFEDNSNCPF